MYIYTFIFMAKKRSDIEFGKMSFPSPSKSQVMQLQIMAQRNRYLRVLCQTGVDELLWELDQAQGEQQMRVTDPAQQDSQRSTRCGALNCFSL